MLWYKAWLDTRWRFIVGLILLTGSAAGIVFLYPRAMRLIAAMPMPNVSGDLGERIREGVALAREYRGYVWSQWFRQTPTQLGVLFAVLLGTGGLLAQASGMATLFTLSLPVSRNRLLAVRAGAGLAEWFVLALVSSLAIPLFSPAVGESYSVTNALVHGLCLFVAGAVFFSLAVLLSTVFNDLWRPLLIACALAFALASLDVVARESPFSIFRVMSGEDYFRTGRIPWIGLTASASASAALLWLAAINFARRDF
jgi:ABC-2 type transport system permease protein